MASTFISKQVRTGTHTRLDLELELMQATWSEARLSLLSYRTQDLQPRDGPTHNVLGPPPSITD